MPEASASAARPRLGLLVNPIAGMGGRVGLKGTDGPEALSRAKALGAVPRSGERAVAALDGFLARWPQDRPRPALLTARGDMGQAVADAVGYPATVVAEVEPPTTAEDTRRVAAALRNEDVDLLLFAGGDGTARDVSDAIGHDIPVLGIPAGVKIQSAAFAGSPRSAGATAAEFLSSTARHTLEREVVDLDEDAYRGERIVPRLHGYLRVPSGRLVQSRKAPSPISERSALAGIAAAVVAGFLDGRDYILGPGTTTRAVMDWLGLPKTLVGVDVVGIEEGKPVLRVADATEDDLLRTVRDGPASIVLTPIGGQGFILGRGNQQISPAVVREVLREVGREGIIVIATPGKLAELGGRPLLVDSGDPDLDDELAGHIRVVSGRHDSAMAGVAVA